MNGEQVCIVGEVGSNHDGDLDLAKRYIRACQQAGADAVKFQTLRRDRIVAPYIGSNGQLVENPSYNLFASLELASEWHYELKNVADEVGIEFLSTPFYLEAVDLLESVGVSTYKIASGDITFFPLLERVGQTGSRVLLSTGASSLQDVEQALDTLSTAGAGEVSLLHCVSNYPPEWTEMNLRAIVTLKEAFDLPVGISDHSPGSLVPIAAVALGATIIEKHISFDPSSPGPDHPFAMAMDEFEDMVQQVRNLQQALGTGKKIPTETELAKQKRIRRGTYDRETLAPTDDPSGLWLRPEHESS